MNWLQSIIYGFVSGLTEFIPVSSRAHQAIMLKLFGQTGSNPILDVLIHSAVLIAVYFSLKNVHNPFSVSRSARSATVPLDRRFVRSAAIPMLIGILLLTYLMRANQSLLLVSLFALCNGIVLFIPGRMLRGNKDARSMSALDGLLAGVAAALSAFPGISRVGAVASCVCARGAHRHHALNWAISLSVPALCVWLLIDIFHLFTAFQPVNFLMVVCYLLAAFSAYAGTYLGIRFVRMITVRVNFSAFAYYSWGAALFAFILYLI